MITLIDYGVGNISAFLNIYKQLNIPAKTAKTAGGAGAGDYATAFPAGGRKSDAAARIATRGAGVVPHDA